MKRFEKTELDEIVKILLNDGVVSVPTDTVYGLCASINSIVAKDKLMDIKKRPQNKLLPLMCANKEQIQSIAILNKIAEKIIDEFMPGPITVILNAKSDLPQYVNNGLDTIAIRMATSKELEYIITKLGCPVFLSSANISGEKPCNNLDEIEKKCPNLDAMLEGNVSFNIGSTIIDCTSDEIKILRQGPVTLKMIKDKLQIK